MVIIKDSTETLYPFVSDSLPEAFLKKAEDELFETLEKKESSLEKIREFISKEKALSCKTSDEFLLQFLRARKFDVNKSFNLLKKYMHFKSKNRALFTGMDYNILVKLIKTRTIGFLPHRCPDGCAIIFVHLDNWDPSDVSVEGFSKIIALFLYHSICDPMTQISGYKVILDVKSHPLKHLRFCTPQNIYLLYNGTQECFPGRFKGIHVVNMSLTFKAAWTLVQPFLSDKIKQRIIFHQKLETLTDYFPKYLLPIEFGGQLKESDTTSWLKNALQEDNLEKLAN